MKRLFILASLASVLLSACSFSLNYEEGSGNLIRETRNIGSVDSVNFGGIGNLNISQGPETMLMVEAEDNILPRIVTEFESGTLTIGFDTDRWENIIRPTEPITFTLQLEDLSDLSLSGWGDVELDQISVGSLTIRLSGAGTIDASGSASRLDLNVSGAGSFDSENLECEDVNVNMSGAGNAVVWATNSLDVSISGLGNVSYYGDPEVHQSVTGLGNIKSLGER